MTPKISNSRILLREIKSNDIFGYYNIFSDAETMSQFGGPVQINDLERRDIVSRKRIENQEGILFCWSVILLEENEFVGFIQLMSYNSFYFDLSFSAIGDAKFNEGFLKVVDRNNGWEIEYALLKEYRNQGIMSDAISMVLNFCDSKKISPIYAKVNSLKNEASVKILLNNSFQPLMPLVADPSLLNEKNIEQAIRDKDFGMMYVR